MRPRHDLSQQALAQSKGLQPSEKGRQQTKHLRTSRLLRLRPKHRHTGLAMTLCCSAQPDNALNFPSDDHGDSHSLKASVAKLAS